MGKKKEFKKFIRFLTWYQRRYNQHLVHTNRTKNVVKQYLRELEADTTMKEIK